MVLSNFNLYKIQPISDKALLSLRDGGVGFDL